MKSALDYVRLIAQAYLDAPAHSEEEARLESVLELACARLKLNCEEEGERAVPAQAIDSDLGPEGAWS